MSLSVCLFRSIQMFPLYLLLLLLLLVFLEIFVCFCFIAYRIYRFHIGHHLQTAKYSSKYQIDHIITGLFFIHSFLLRPISIEIAILFCVLFFFFFYFLVLRFSHQWTNAHICTSDSYINSHRYMTSFSSVCIPLHSFKTISIRERCICNFLYCALRFICRNKILDVVVCVRCSWFGRENTAGRTSCVECVIYGQHENSRQRQIKFETHKIKREKTKWNTIYEGIQITYKQPFIIIIIMIISIRISIWTLL